MNGLDKMAVVFQINGREQRVEATPDKRLIDLLRDNLELTAAKKSCGVGRCGSCTILLDGMPANACLLMLWQLEGRSIVTPEGLDIDRDAEIVRSALAAENAFQCGYCAPGFSIVLMALFRDNPHAGDIEIRAALEGNICRCTGYHSIIRGALAAAEALRSQRISAGARP